MSPLLRTVALFLAFISLVSAQSVSTASADGSGYTGYNLTLSQDEESATYDTSSTPANVSVSFRTYYSLHHLGITQSLSSSIP